MASETRKDRPDPLDDYGIGDLSDDPFASPEPEPSSKKRKEAPSGLGIDEEVTVDKKARAPRVKLDGARLLSKDGIPKLRKRAANLKIKGKGHEFSDAARLLSFYQLWLDDLFPKAKFLDALDMVEKAGHKRDVMAARQGWLDEGKAKRNGYDIDEDVTPDQPTAEDGPTLQPSTPPRADVPDDNLYDATPRAPRVVPTADTPDDDGLDALMHESEAADAPSTNQARSDDPEEDDLDALMAEAEVHDGGEIKQTHEKPREQHDFADEEAAMGELGDHPW